MCRYQNVGTSSVACESLPNSTRSGYATAQFRMIPRRLMMPFRSDQPRRPHGRLAGAERNLEGPREAPACGSGHSPDEKKDRRRWTISRILFPAQRPKAPSQTTTIPLAPPSLAGSSDLPGGFGRAVLMTPPYLVLLRAGFSLPFALRRTRCALTAPFHPYLTCAREARAGGRYIFCATFLQVALTGGYPAHCPLEFGLSSPRNTTA